MKKLYVVGSGPGDIELLTNKAKEIIKTVERVLTTSRISDNFNNAQDLSLSELLKKLEDDIQDTVVLVSGDCNFYSLSKIITEKFNNKYALELHSGISSLQYFSSKIKKSYDDALMISMHQRNAQIVARVSYNKKIFLLTGGDYPVKTICEILYNHDIKDVVIKVGERLSYEDEKITTGTPASLKDMEFHELAVMYIENINFQNPYIPLRDDDFIRDKVPMTKENIRWLTADKLVIEPTDIIYDIGAGTGSVSIEMARRANQGFVYAIEMKDIAVSLMKKNRIKNKAFNMKIIQDKAPDGINKLPKPDKVFIGGSSGNIDEIVKTVLMKNPKTKIVANAISLQSLNEIINAYENHEMENIDIICVNISKAKKIGRHNLMMANNPIYIITGQGSET